MADENAEGAGGELVGPQPVLEFDDHTCVLCKKTLSRKSSLVRHVSKSCIVSKLGGPCCKAVFEDFASFMKHTCEAKTLAMGIFVRRLFPGI